MALNEDKENQNMLPMKKRDFLRSGLIEIASGREDIGTKRLKKGEEVMIGKLKVLLEEPVTKYSNMNKLQKKLKLEEMETRMLVLLQEDEDKDFKKAEMERKKSFLDWVKECDETDNDDVSKNLKLLGDEAMRQGFRIAGLLSKIMIMVRKNEVGKRNFQGLIDSLKYVSQGVDSEEIARMLDFLKAVDGLFWKKEPKNLERFSQRNTGEAGSQGREQNVIKEHVSLLLKEIFRLELFWMNEELPHSKMSVKDEFPSLQAKLNEYRDKFSKIEDEINKLPIPSAEELEEIKKSEEYKTLNSKRREMWKIKKRKMRRAKKQTNN